MGRLAALVVLLACAGTALAARQLQADAAGQPVLRVGFGTEPRVPMSSLENGEPEGERSMQALQLLELTARHSQHSLSTFLLALQLLPCPACCRPGLCAACAACASDSKCPALPAGLEGMLIDAVAKEAGYKLEVSTVRCMAVASPGMVIACMVCVSCPPARTPPHYACPPAHPKLLWTPDRSVGHL